MKRIREKRRTETSKEAGCERLFSKTNPPKSFRKMQKAPLETPPKIPSPTNPKSFFLISSTIYSHFFRPAAHPPEILVRERQIYGDSISNRS